LFWLFLRPVGDEGGKEDDDNLESVHLPEHALVAGADGSHAFKLRQVYEKERKKKKQIGKEKKRKWS
jgi:hypothetical protein